MRIEAAVTSISWIPSEAVTGLTKAGFSSGVMHYDDPPPDYLEDLAALHKAERFRFANRLAAWAEVENGRVVDAGHAGRGYISSTRVSFGVRGGVTFQPTEFPNYGQGRNCAAARRCSARRPAAGPGCRFPGRCAASRSSSGWHRPCGPRCG